MSNPLVHKIPNCPLCGNNVPTTGERFVIQQLDLQVRVVECPVCGLVYKEYVPSEILTSAIYGGDYVHYKQADGASEKSSEERVGRMGRPSGLRHLDYGCGGGGLTRCAMRLGWDSYGVDPFLPECLSSGPHGARFFKASAESGLIRKIGAFDRISMWAVIEHLNQPLATFQGLAGCLKPGGRILFNAPNADSLIARRNGASWGIALLLEHLTFWTEKSIRYLAQQAGLDIVAIKRCGTPYPFGKSVPSWRSFGLREPLGETAIQFEKLETSDLRTGSVQGRILQFGQLIARDALAGRFFRLALQLFGIGDHFYAVFQKKDG